MQRIFGMTEVIQIYKSVYAIDKSDYNSNSRSSIKDWPDAIQSKTGYVADKKLFLPYSQRSNPDIKNSDLIIIQDIEGFDPFLINNELRNSNLPDWFKESRSQFLLSQNLQIKCFPSLTSRCDFEIFKIAKTDKSNFEFSLNYIANQYSIGLPKREDHKIGILNNEKSFTYRINGKIDGHSQRVFMEYKYAIEYIGKIDSVEFLAPNKIKGQKHLPKNNLKNIDERKVLK
ncbi:hypothetical protein [Olleya sp. HaHaR_3_96]|uniref:hypothetical protein n=1 Tax=Olleya sp. HaHaR_3_96 TaxID=2745560 RepID=UPI001C4ED207|nr:hypothetical protein [Olleya sp. HaHaR_3_96]QXP58573.1 hypothetical protein H0I26_11655 [Olleya sp. HaHaR_3_96]